MNWIIFIIATIVLIWLHHLYQNKIDRKEKRTNVSSCPTNSPWLSLQQKFKSYLDFKVINETTSSLLIANNKGEEFDFQMVTTNSVIVYKVNGITKKEWKFPFWVHENIMYNDIDKFYKEESIKMTSKSDVSSSVWRVIEERPFNLEEIDLVTETIVVASKYGKCCCFFMKSGCKAYIPIANDANVAVGEIIDLTKVKVQTLSKDGKADINRIKI